MNARHPDRLLMEMSGSDSSDMRLPLPLSPHAIYITLGCCVWHRSTDTFQTACRFREPQRGHLISTGHKRENIHIFKVEENTSHYLCHLVSKHAVFLRNSECLMNFSCLKYHWVGLCWTDKHCRCLQTKDIEGFATEARNQALVLWMR